MHSGRYGPGKFYVALGNSYSLKVVLCFFMLFADLKN